MEAFQTTFSGHKVTIIFNGPHYLFHNPYFGFFAFAEREGADKFNVKYGNHHCTGGSFTPSFIRAKVAAFIRKNERRFVPRNCEFAYEECDLADSFLSIADGFKMR